jgi:predicted RNA-binding protein
MKDERKYFLAIVRPENLELLERAGLEFYALKKGTSIRAGDRIVLYRSKGAARNKAGIVGAFEVIADPHAAERSANEGVLYTLYPTRVPWRPIATSLEKPMPIVPLVPDLQMFPNKERYGSVLQLSMKRLSSSDYELIERALKKHVAQT